MKTVPLSEAKARLSSLLDAVEGHDEEIVITRNGRAATVLVSPGDFESWKETVSARTFLCSAMREFSCSEQRRIVVSDFAIMASTHRGMG